jgi:hypothetical protein
MPRRNNKHNRRNRFDTIEVNGKNFRIDETVDDKMNIIKVLVPLSRKRLSDDDRISLSRKASYKGIYYICLGEIITPLLDYSSLSDYEKPQLLTA